MVTVETKPTWSSSSFLIYLGGWTVLQGASLALLYLAFNFQGSGDVTAWALLLFVILTAIAFALRRADRWLPAGIFAYNSVTLWAVLVIATLNWWGWENGTFRDFTVWSWPRLLAEVLVLLAATATRRRFKFPYLRSISAPVGALFVIDLVTKGHGNSLAVVALLIGLAYLFFGHVSDKPSTFWLHLDAAVLIGAPIIYWCHRSTFDFAVLAFMSLVYVVWAYWTKRSSWAVFGTIGFIIVATYFVAKAVEDTTQAASFNGGSPVSGLWFVPLAMGLLGFWLVLLGMAGKRKKGDKHEPIKTETKPVWTPSSFLVYTGGLTILFGATVGLTYLGYEDRGDGARAGWTLLFLAIIYGLAHALRLRGRWVAAGILAFVSVLVWGALVILTMLWIGWHPFVFVRSGGFLGGPFVPGGAHLLTGDSPVNPLSTWSWSRMLFWILLLAAAWYDRRVFKFPFIRLISAVVSWFLIVDLVTSGHGNWFVVVSLLTGLAYLVIGNVIDKPSAFWLHLVGGLLIGGALLDWFNTGDGDFAVISICALLYVLVAYWTKRSSWAVLGAIGFFAATDHYLSLGPHTGLTGPAGLLLQAREQCTASLGGPETCTSYGPSISPWSPALAYGLLGFWLVGLGMLGMHKKAHKHAAVVVETTTLVVETPAEPPAAEPPVMEPPAAGPPADEPPLDEPPAG